MSRVEPTVRQISVDILERTARNGAFADELIAQSLAKWDLIPEDKSLLMELVQGTLRWRGQLDWILAQMYRGDFEKCPGRLKRVLEISLYQLRFLDRVPDYAAVNEAVDLAKQYGSERWGKIANGMLRNYLRNAKRFSPLTYETEPVKAVAVNFSHPEWMVRRWFERYGLKKTIALCEYNNRRPSVSLRINLKKISREELLSEFQEHDIPATVSEYFPDFVKIRNAADFTQLASFRNGCFTVQDESTALAPLLLAPEKGDTVVDLCAAPGGKTGHIAHLMQGSGRLLAVDRDARRMQRLRQNVERLGLNSVTPIIGDGTTLHFDSVDKILIDAPCSGLGVLAKRADLRWKRTENDIRKIRKTQLSLLKNAARFLKRNGVLVYSTCTIEPEENEEIVTQFLQEQDNFRAEPVEWLQAFTSADGYVRSLPFEHEIDGTFAVRLIKN